MIEFQDSYFSVGHPALPQTFGKEKIQNVLSLHIQYLKTHLQFLFPSHLNQFNWFLKWVLMWFPPLRADPGFVCLLWVTELWEKSKTACLNIPDWSPSQKLRGNPACLWSSSYNQGWFSSVLAQSSQPTLQALCSPQMGVGGSSLHRGPLSSFLFCPLGKKNNSLCSL